MCSKLIFSPSLKLRHWNRENCLSHTECCHVIKPDQTGLRRCFTWFPDDTLYQETELKTHKVTRCRGCPLFGLIGLWVVPELPLVKALNNTEWEMALKTELLVLKEIKLQLEPQSILTANNYALTDYSTTKFNVCSAK